MPESVVSREAVTEVLQLLVSTPSVNPTLAPDEAGNEQEIASVTKDWLEKHGVRAWVDVVQPGRCNAVGQVGQGDRVLVLCGHIDTVATSGMTIPPFEPRMDGNRLYGRGAYDMKGGVAAIMCALAALRDAELRGA
jgi:acetylornithine deacetylase